MATLPNRVRARPRVAVDRHGRLPRVGALQLDRLIPQFGDATRGDGAGWRQPDVVWQVVRRNLCAVRRLATDRRVAGAAHAGVAPAAASIAPGRWWPRDRPLNDWSRTLARPDAIFRHEHPGGLQ